MSDLNRSHHSDPNSDAVDAKKSVVAAYADAAEKIKALGSKYQTELGRSHKSLVNLGCEILTFATSYPDPEPMIDGLKKLDVRVSKSTRDKPILLAVKLALPKIDSKTQSGLGRALVYVSTAKPANKSVEEFIAATGGIDACARAYAKARKEAKTGDTSLVESPHDQLRSLVTPAELTEDIDLPKPAGLYLLLVERQLDGAMVNYGHVEDSGLINRACKVVKPIARLG